MIMRPRTLLFFSLVACSSDDAFGPGALPVPAAPPSPRPPGLSPRDVQVLGSYEVTFDTVGEPLPPASIGNRARLDIREGPNATLAAYMTPRWGEHHVFKKADLSQDEVVLDDYFANVKGMTFVSASGEKNEWRRFHLPRNADGSLAGTFRATDMAQHDGRGAVRLDTLAPEIRLEPPAPSRGGKYLPWDQLVFRFAEPLSARAFAKAVPDLGFAESATDVTVMGGTPRSLDGPSRPLTVTSLRDPSGNMLVPFSTDLAAHTVGEPREGYDFEDALSVGMWGTAERVVDARCLTGGCIVFPAASQTTCTPAGIAGVLTTKGRRKVFATVRVRASVDINILPPLALVGFGPPESIQGFVLTSYQFQKTGTGALPYETTYRSLVLAFTKAPEKVGFSLARATCDTPALPTATDAQVETIIESVTMLD